MKLSRTVGYALQAVLQLADAEPDTPIPCSRLAAQGRMPVRFLLQILRNLVTHGILHSARGVDGGYMLKRSTDDISLLELIEAVDGPQQALAPKMEGLPSDALEKLSVALNGVCAVARRQLSNVRLASLMPRRRKPAEPDGGKRKPEATSIGG